MSISVYDSSNSLLQNLYQWDLNQVITIRGAESVTNPECHFANQELDEAYMVVPTVSGTDISVKIPNIILQYPHSINLFLYVDTQYSGQRTKYKIIIPVVPRPKPGNYVSATDDDYITIKNSLSVCEAWAVGKRHGVDVPPSDETYHNNAKYWAEQSHQYTVKGDPGDPGAAAGFGTPTITVGSGSGIPSATITASGPDTAKVFSFAFDNLKGAKGDSGVYVGSGTIPQGYNIQIDPTGTADVVITDAPSDGKQYARKNAAWVQVSGSGSDVIDDNAAAGTVNKTWSVNKLTTEFAGVAEINDAYQTVLFNQPISNGNFASDTVWDFWGCSHTVSNNVATLSYNNQRWGGATYENISVPIGHHFYVRVERTDSVDKYTTLNFHTGEWPATIESDRIYCGKNSVSSGIIINNTTSDLTRLVIGVELEAGVSFSFKNVFTVDLTAMFGAGNEPTAEEFERLFPREYYDYDAGTQIHIPLLSAIYRSEAAFEPEKFSSGHAVDWSPYISYGLPILSVNCDLEKLVSKDNEQENVSVSYADNRTITAITFTETCKIKPQGNSSMMYPKKNFTIKFTNGHDFGWGSQTKYCLKANYIDPSHARNICSAKLWASIVNSWTAGTSGVQSAPNKGAIDGFPIILLANGKFYGLYTLNIPKDKWTFGMGAATTEVILSAEGGEDPDGKAGFKAPITVTDLENETIFSVEYKPDAMSLGTIVSSYNALQSVIGTGGASFWDNIANLAVRESFLDYYIFSCLLSNFDGVTKNFLLYNYNVGGTGASKWGISAYDMDSTFGNQWYGGEYLSPTNCSPTFTSYATANKLMELIKTYKLNELKARYKVLRGGILSEENVLLTFTNFVGNIPDTVKTEEHKRWPQLRGISTEDLTQIMNDYRIRCAAMDAEMGYPAGSLGAVIENKAEINEAYQTVKFNQLCPNGNFASDTGWGYWGCTHAVTNNVAELSYTDDTWCGIWYPDLSFAVGHKFYLTFERIDTTYQWSQISLKLPSPTEGEDPLAETAIIGGVSDKIKGVVQNTSEYVLTEISFGTTISDGNSIKLKNFMVVDLTEMFGSGNEPTAEEFEKMFPNEYYAYDVGTTIHVPMLNSAKVITSDLVGKQNKIWVNGLLKSDGTTDISAAVAGTDYVVPSALALTDKKLKYLSELTKGQAWDIEDGTTPAYQHTVPNGAKSVAINKVGGKSCVFNQLFNPSGYENNRTHNGITFTNSNGTITANGTATGLALYYCGNNTTGASFLITGHLYLLIGCASGGSLATYYISKDGNWPNADCGDGSISTWNNSDVRGFYIAVRSGTTLSNAIFKPQIFDLTQMFGSGNEPTVAEFRAMFPDDYYEYNTGSLMSANVTSVDSKDSDNVSLGSLAIPQSLRTAHPLHSAGTAYDEYDIERKKFVQRVGSVDLGTMNWSYNPQSGAERMYCGLTDAKHPSGYNESQNIICVKYETSTHAGVTGHVKDNIIALSTGTSVFVYSSTMGTDPSSFKASLSGQILYYELATPVETDISEYFSDDNLLTVEAGGTLTFTQDNSTESNLLIPNGTEYAINLSEATR